MSWIKNPTAITQSSFTIIQQELHDMGVTLDPEIAPIIERMIHSSADFDFAHITQYTDDAVSTGIRALQGGCAVVCDVNMIRVGIGRQRLADLNSTLHCFVAEPDAYTRARAEDTTRSAIGMRIAHEQGLLDGGIVAIGNAPTALYELIDLIKHHNVRPALIIGVPVGFISSVESKDALIASISEVPWIATQGRKGGSPIAVSVVNALLRLAIEAPRYETD